MGEPLKVSLVGDASGLTAVLDKALAKVQAMGVGMEASVGNAMDKALARTQAAGKGMEGALGGVDKVASGLVKNLLGLGASLLAGFSLRKVIDDTVEWGTETIKLQRALGGTKGEASVLAMAIDDIHGNVEDFLAGAGKLTKTLNGNETAIKRLGVETRDSNGRFKDTPTLIAEINAKLGQFTEGTDRNIEAQKVYGKSYAEMLKFIQLTPEVMDAARAKAQSLNLEMSPQKAAIIKAYRDAQNDVGDVIKGVAVTIGLKLMPVLTDMGDWFAKKGPQLIERLGKSFDFLQAVLSNTVVRLGLFLYALNVSLLPTVKTAWTALSAFAVVLNERVSAALFLGLTRTQAWTGALLQSINPMYAALAVLGLLALAVNYYATSASRAAKASLALAEKASDSSSKFQSLTERALGLDKVLKDGKLTTEERTKAQDRMAIVMAQLKELYPDFNDYLVDEAGNQRDLATAIKEKNAATEEELKLSLAKAEVELARAQQDYGQKQGKATRSLALSGVPGMGGLGSGILGAFQAKEASDAGKAVDTLRLTVEKYRAVLLGDGTAPQKNSPGGIDSESNLAKLKADLERWKANEEAKADASGQFREVSKQEEADWLDQRKNGYKLNAKELYQVELDVSKLRRGVRLDEFEAEQARLQTMIEAARNDGAERIRLAEEIAARESAAGDARAKQAEAAKQAVIKIRREVAQEEAGIRAEQLESARAHQLALLQLDEDEVKRQLELGQISVLDAQARFRKIESARFDASRQALEAQLEDDTKTEAQREKLYSQLQALDDAYDRKRLEQKAAVNAELRKTDGLAGWMEGLRGALAQGQDYFQQFKDMATSVVSGVTNAFGTGIEGILSGQMTLGEGLKSIWQGILSTIIKGLAQIAAQWIVTAALKAVVKKREQSTAAGAAITAQHLAAAETWAAYAGIPFYGQAMALAQIAVMNASLLANLAGATATGATATALAVGGRISSPTLALMGEAGPEIVAPEHDFNHWATNLTTMGADLGASIARRQAATEGYGLAGAGYAAAAAAQGGRNIAQGGSFTGGGHLFDFRGAMFLGESAESSRQFQNAVKNALDGYDWAKG